MTDLVTFDFDGDAVRTFMVDGEPWFVGRDVCRCLDLESVSKALERLDEDERRDGVNISDPIGREQATILISEPGVYSLILTSRKPEAKRFKKWVTSVVLPSIRKTGAYGRPQLTVEATTAALQIVREARLVFGKSAAQRIWRSVGLADPGQDEFGEASGSATIDDRNRVLLASVHDFLSDCCEKDPTSQVQAIKLYQAYNRWASSTQTPLMTNTMFGRLMMHTGVKRHDGHTRTYVGVRLKADVLRKLDA